MLLQVNSNRLNARKLTLGLQLAFGRDCSGRASQYWLNIGFFEWAAGRRVVRVLRVFHFVVRDHLAVVLVADVPVKLTHLYCIWHLLLRNLLHFDVFLANFCSVCVARMLHSQHFVQRFNCPLILQIFCLLDELGFVEFANSVHFDVLAVTRVQEFALEHFVAATLRNFVAFVEVKVQN